MSCGDRLTSPPPAAAVPRVQCKNPSRDLPIGLLGSLSIVTVLYILAVLTICLMLPYTLIPSTSAFSSVRKRRGWSIRENAQRLEGSFYCPSEWLERDFGPHTIF